MSLPDIQRILLLIGIAICAYLLIQAWVSDAEKRAQESDAGNVQSTPLSHDEVTGTSTTAEPPDVPQPIADSGEGLDSDVPDPSLIQTSEGSLAVQESTSLDRSLIEVKTPLFHVWIDPVGGDIVGVKLIQYPVSLREPDTPMTLLDRRFDRTYVAQSGLTGADGFDQSQSRPTYSVSKTEWVLDQETLEVPLRYEQDGVRVTKTFTFYENDYHVNVDCEVRNGMNREFSATFFAQLKRDGGPVDGERGGFIRPPAYVGGAATTNDKRYQRLKFKDIEKSPFREPVDGGWVAIVQHYFLSAWIPEQATNNLLFANRDRQGNYRIGFTAPAKVVPVGSTGNYGATFYVGPKHQRTLEALAPHLSLTVDYGFFWWLSMPMFKILEWIQSIVQNWGLAIILMTILIKTALFPLSQMSYKSMAKMRKLSPQIKRIQERYGSDRQKVGQEMMALYAKEKTNPLAGCLPMLLQMPVFFALYWVLIESVELRQAPFVLWIRDLSAMDPLFVLPILNAGAMFLMQRLNPPMPDPMQQRVMMMMPIMFGFICVFMPAGLVLYWVVNSLYSMAHHYWALKRAGATQTT